MIRACADSDFEAILDIINDGARAYRGIIPHDRWKEPYMHADELLHEIAGGVAFFGHEGAGGGLVGVMGIQPVMDVILIRHAYVRTSRQRQGVGAALLRNLTSTAERPVLLGTWRDARWAIRFYEKHGFRVVDGGVKDRLLKTYWEIPARQVETSVVLADARAAARFAPPPPTEEEDPEDPDR